MPLSIDAIQTGSQLFFKLLKEKILPLDDNLAQEYLNSPDVREVVSTMAGEGEMIVFNTRKNIHLVTTAYNSIFASSYTQMKAKYKELKLKKYFHLSNIIICVFLAEVDKESSLRVRWEEEGISYARMEKMVSDTLESWKKRQEEEDTFSQDWGIALEEIYELWNVQFSPFKTSKVDDSINVTHTSSNRYSFIYTSLKPLADQSLIYNNTNELVIIPREELYERLDRLYHNRERYKSFMKLIEKSKEEGVEKGAENK